MTERFMFTASLSMGDLDFTKPEEAAAHMLGVSAWLRPIHIDVTNQHTGAEVIVTIGVGEFDHRCDTVDALAQAESFISGFEDDELQEGIPELLAGLRAAIQREQARPDLLAVLKLAVTDWPQFDAEPAMRQPGCQPDDNIEVNGGDLVEWFGNWRRAFVLPAIAKAEGQANG